MAIIRQSVKGSELEWDEGDGNLDYVDRLSPVVLTIASGTIVVPSTAIGPAVGVFRIETEGGAGTDDLTSITGGKGREEPIILVLNTPGRVITVVHTPPNLLLQNSANFLLNSVNDSIELRSRTTTIWREMHRCSI